MLVEILDVSAEWYNLGLLLKVKTGTLDSIRTEFYPHKNRLREVVKAWLAAGDNPSWKTLRDALGSPVVGANYLANVLEAKYCPVQQTEPDIGYHSETDFLKPSPVSEPIRRVISQQIDTHKRLRK